MHISRTPKYLFHIIIAVVLPILFTLGVGLSQIPPVRDAEMATIEASARHAVREGALQRLAVRSAANTSDIAGFEEWDPKQVSAVTRQIWASGDFDKVVEAYLKHETILVVCLFTILVVIGLAAVLVFRSVRSLPASSGAMQEGVRSKLVAILQIYMVWGLLAIVAGNCYFESIELNVHKAFAASAAAQPIESARIAIGQVNAFKTAVRGQEINKDNITAIVAASKLKEDAPREAIRSVETKAFIAFTLWVVVLVALGSMASRLFDKLWPRAWLPPQSEEKPKLA